MNKDVLSALEAASEAAVMADPADLNGLAALHTHLETIATTASEAELDEVVAQAAQASAQLVEAIVLQEVNDPGYVLEAIGETLIALQSLVRDERPIEEVTFPARLGLTATEPPAARPVAQPPVKTKMTVPVVEAPVQETVLQGDKTLLGDFVLEAREHLENADVHLLTLETEPENEEALNAVFRAFHTIKGVAGFLALDDIQHLAHEAENLLDLARKGALSMSGGPIDVSFEAVDMLKGLLNRVESALNLGGKLMSDPLMDDLVARLKVAATGKLEAEPVEPASEDSRLGEILLDRGVASEEAIARALTEQREPTEVAKVGELLLKAELASKEQVAEALAIQEVAPDRGKVGEILVEVGAVRALDVERALAKQQEGPKLGELLVRAGDAAAKEVAQALRSQNEAVQVKDLVKVDADRLDRLVDLIGELVIAESMVSQSTEMRQNTGPAVLRHLNQMDKITRALQEMGTSLRMVPIRSTFQKMARLARDVAKKSGKTLEFVTVGEDTELDKSVVDKIGDPLVHMVRNAVDHGLEANRQERIDAGKSPAGRVELRAFHKGGGIHIEIEDDGRGLDRDAILAKAIERGLVREGETLSDREVWDLIFQPGFSTAKQVTDVSGRGVGMDVVKRNIDALRGRVEVRTERGRGTVISVRLPLTLAIIDGMVVGIGSERYVIPTLSIVRSIRPRIETISTVAGRGELLNLDGTLLPIFRLGRLFSSASARQDLTDGLIVVAENDGRQVGLAVDSLLGQQQIVIKPLGEGLRHAPGIAGGAVMPDGEVGLILDVAGLMTMAYDTGKAPVALQKAEEGATKN